MATNRSQTMTALMDALSWMVRYIYVSVRVTHFVLDLFAAIGSNSLEDFTACIKHPYFRGLENDYVKLLRNMEMPEGGANNIDFNADPGSSATFPDFNQAGETPNLNDEPDFC